MGDGPSIVEPCPLADLCAIEVLVIDLADQPVADVLLSLRRDERETTARTDSRGMVRFDGLKEGAHTLLAPEWDKSACVADGERPLPPSRLKSNGGPPAWRAIAADAGPDQHTVEEGEHLTTLAFRFGYSAQALWDFERNAGLKRTRGSMLVRAGDRLALPPRKPETIAAGTGRFYYLRIITTPAELRLRFIYEDGSPRAGERYAALSLLANGDTASLDDGQLDDDGVLTTRVPVDAVELEVTVGDGTDQEVYRLNLGGYEPPDGTGGVQSRLAALGYYLGELDDEAGPMMAEALAAFQEDFELPVTGTADEATVDKLVQVYGS